MKPRIGSTVSRTPEGLMASKGASDVLGDVIAVDGAICIVREPCGDINRFIWQFPKGDFNRYFTWKGKPQ